MLQLRKDIFMTPKLLRQLLKHPILPGESLNSSEMSMEYVDFRNKEISRFSLQYLAKFICEIDVDRLSINGEAMPLRQIVTDNLTELNMRDAGLYSEDLFVLSQALKRNRSLKSINLSKNMIGLTFKDEKQIMDIKLKN